MRKRLAFTTFIVVATGLAMGTAASAATDSPVIGLTAGDAHTCALRADGSVACWGDNAYGQLGNPDAESGSTVVEVTLPADAHIVDIAAGVSHTCALAQDHRVFCWGYNGWGSLGLGSFQNENTPQLVTLAASAAQPSSLTAGGFTTCVAMSNGHAQCWGRNQYGEVGDGTRTLRNVPTNVTGIADAVDIEAGLNHTCVVRAVGTMQCWGRGLDGRAGDPTMPNVARVSAGSAHTCARTTTGGLRCWGDNTFGQLTPNNITAGVADVTTGAAHTCVATEEGRVMCWGSNALGQLGNYGDLSGVEEVAAGANHTCARLVDASVWCWGSSIAGQAGDHVLVPASTAVRLVAPYVAPTPTPTTPTPTVPTPTVPTPAVEVPNAPAPQPPQPVNEAPVAAAPSVDTPTATIDDVAVATPAVEKQAAAEPTTKTVPEAPFVLLAPAPSERPVAPKVSKRTVDLRVGQQLGLGRLGRIVGVRLPGTLIVSNMSRSRSVSAHAASTMRVEVRLDRTRVCRNVLTPVITTAVRVMRAGECTVRLTVVRPGRAAIVREVVVRGTGAKAARVNRERNVR